MLVSTVLWTWSSEHEEADAQRCKLEGQQCTQRAWAVSAQSERHAWCPCFVRKSTLTGVTGVALTGVALTGVEGVLLTGVAGVALTRVGGVALTGVAGTAGGAKIKI